MQKNSVVLRLFLLAMISIMGLELVGAESTLPEQEIYVEPLPWEHIRRIQERDTRAWLAEKIEEIVLGLESASDEAALRKLQSDFKKLLFIAIGIADRESVQEILDYFVDELGIVNIQDIAHPTSGELLLDYAIQDLITMSATARTVYDSMANQDRMEIVRYLRERLYEGNRLYFVSPAILTQVIESNLNDLKDLLLDSQQSAEDRQQQQTERVQRVGWETPLERPLIPAENLASEQAEQLDSSPENSSINIYEDLIRQAGFTLADSPEELLAALRLSADLIERPQSTLPEESAAPESEAAQYYANLIDDMRMMLGSSPEDEFSRNYNFTDSSSSFMSNFTNNPAGNLAGQEILAPENNTACCSPNPVRPNTNLEWLIPVPMMAASRAEA